MNEALPPIARYKIGYHADEWGQRSSTPGGIPDHAGSWVRYADHVAALVEAQQPAPSAAAAVGQEPPGVHALMCVISSLRDTAHFSDEEGDATDDLRTLRDWALAQAAAPQPSPTPQAADSVLEDAARSERERICAAIKVEDDYCVEQGDYMLDSDDCIKIARGDWVRPDFSVVAARKQGASHD